MTSNESSEGATSKTWRDTIEHMRKREANRDEENNTHSNKSANNGKDQSSKSQSKDQSSGHSKGNSSGDNKGGSSRAHVSPPDFFSFNDPGDDFSH
ncbi:hypothetical protein AAE478_007550 [Parahypoxylon ruwenzoriense]